MAVPIDDLLNTFLDETTDDPSQARVELNNLLLKLKALLAAIGVGANNALKLDSNGNIPTGVALSDPVALTSGGTGATTAVQALINFGLQSPAAKLNYTNIATLGNAEPSKVITSNASNGVNLNGLSILPPVTGGLVNAYTITIGISAYETGRIYTVAIHTQNTGTSTIDFDGLGAVPIVLESGNNLFFGLLPKLAQLYYDGTNFILLNKLNKYRGVRAFINGGDYPIVSGSGDFLPLDTATLDEMSIFSSGNFYFPDNVILVKGTFSIRCTLLAIPTVDGYVDLSIYVNGAFLTPIEQKRVHIHAGDDRFYTQFDSGYYNPTYDTYMNFYVLNQSGVDISVTPTCSIEVFE